MAGSKNTKAKHPTIRDVKSPDAVVFKNKKDKDAYLELWKKKQAYDNIKAGNNGIVKGKEAECCKFLGIEWKKEERGRILNVIHGRMKVCNEKLAEMAWTKGERDLDAIFTKFAKDVMKLKNKLPKEVKEHCEGNLALLDEALEGWYEDEDEEDEEV